MKTPSSSSSSSAVEAPLKWRGAAFTWRRCSTWWSYKRAAVAFCCVNLVAALFVLRSLSTSLDIFSSSSSSLRSNPFSDFVYTEDQVKMVEESIRVRRDLEPAELLRLAKELKEEFSREERKLELPRSMKQMLANEILQRLKGVRNDTNITQQREVVELWRADKRKEVKRMKLSNSSISAQEAKMIERALESNWFILAEDIGLWIPEDVINKEINDKPENEQEFEEEEFIAGRPVPPECHAQPRTDYDGAAVRWGLTHHKESAADCCEACFEQAKHAKAGEMKCNIWVYCASESGCYSPDIYEHRHQECWLKQAEKPRVNFKDKYSESYRNSHPKAPVVVPWISGIVNS